MPLLTKYLSLKKHDTFTCDVYFVSLYTYQNLKWAMVNSIVIRDNTFGSVAIKASGNFSFRIFNVPLFMNSLFGKIVEFNQDDIFEIGCAHKKVEPANNRSWEFVKERTGWESSTDALRMYINYRLKKGDKATACEMGCLDFEYDPREWTTDIKLLKDVTRFIDNCMVDMCIDYEFFGTCNGNTFKLDLNKL